jgi:hypothetical protein
MERTYQSLIAEKIEGLTLALCECGQCVKGRANGSRGEEYFISNADWTGSRYGGWNPFEVNDEFNYTADLNACRRFELAIAAKGVSEWAKYVGILIGLVKYPLNAVAASAEERVTAALKYLEQKGDN